MFFCSKPQLFSSVSVSNFRQQLSKFLPRWRKMEQQKKMKMSRNVLLTFVIHWRNVCWCAKDLSKWWWCFCIQEDTFWWCSRWHDPLVTCPISERVGASHGGRKCVRTNKKTKIFSSLFPALYNLLPCQSIKSQGDVGNIICIETQNSCQIIWGLL